jgi:hypothetical protein
MAKKRAPEKPIVNATSTEEALKAVRLELPFRIHRELRIEAARRDTHMSALARIAVEEFLDRREPSELTKKLHAIDAQRDKSLGKPGHPKRGPVRSTNDESGAK